ncbi:DUF551 domain-containing protein [Raoultella ornithinolytica]|uniref:DUF551 domain-containing protein n=1 Tax=Raoultella ornithinolytica TaxID=54291 RepID=UPI00292AAE78|nr:DUF551 domain-containing protein [Raoultella ornithinolytica]MDV1090736.1 DUF551 domain-containing protein [Raoultella ornithinolytica]MDV1119083.1 DUF551 domain-containing protein [Raoultella ornithinolytica]MDV1889447.1 DUF551 domain-containing protein [Raoultella ornithinolytica]
MAKSTITRERMEEIRDCCWMNDLGLSMDELSELARMALAAMDSEPAPESEKLALENLRSAMEGIGHIRRTLEETFGGLHGTHVEPDVLAECKAICDAIYAAYRHAQPAPVVPEEKPMPNPLSMYAVDAVAAIAEAKGWNACRAAMLQGKAEPVSLHPELSVWYGSMPESNGKINWTAILHRKGECLSTGITIELSEYPERVRYEADRVRHIIGELNEEPDILAYDADEHSGYVKPGNSPVIPDGYRLQPISEYEAMCATVNSDEWPQRWIPVSERMPEDRTQVILWDAEIGEVTSGHYSHKTHTFYHCGDAIQNEITHWMPLPADPQEVNHG